jgi:hypothetical protein
VALFSFYLAVQLSDPRYATLLGIDRNTYREAGLRVLHGGAWFYPEQVAGLPYDVHGGHVMYPRVAILWLVPAALLPDLLWWAIPLVVIAAAVIHHRPSPWRWVAIGLCLAVPATSQVLIVGNPGLWIAAAIAVGTVWRPAFALVFLKPSLFPFAILGVRSRGWWLLSAVGFAVSLLMLPLTLQWLGVILNARGEFSGPLYSLRDVPLALIPILAGSVALSGRRGCTQSDIPLTPEVHP